MTGKSLELMNFTAVPLHPPFLPTLHEKSNAFSPFPLAETQHGGVILSRTQLSDVNRHLSLICCVCACVEALSWIITVVHVIKSNELPGEND